MTRQSVTKGIAQWVLERLLDLCIGTLVVGILLFAFSANSHIFSHDLNIAGGIGETLQLAMALVILFYTYFGFVVTTTLHNIFTRNFGIQKRANILAMLSLIHFTAFPVVIFGSLIVEDTAAKGIVLASFLGGLTTIFAVNTIGTRFIRQLLRVGIDQG